MKNDNRPDYDSDRILVSTKAKIAFGMGGSAENAVLIAFNTFNFLFYNGVLGLSGTLCGLAISIALVINAVADPIVGMISDRFHSRLGRRHPFIYLSAIPFGLFFFLIYSPPEGIHGYALFAWFVIFSTLLNISKAFYQIPHLALGAELSKGYHQRSAITSYKMLLSVLGAAITYFFAWTYFNNEGGVDSAETGSFQLIGLTVGIFATAAMLSTAHFTRQYIPRLGAAPPRTRLSLKTIYILVRNCLRNRNLVYLVAGMALFNLTMGIRDSIHSYMNLYYWVLDEGQIRFFGAAVIPGALLAFIIAPLSHRRFAKHSVAMFSIFFAILAAALPVLLRMTDLMPENENPALFSIILIAILTWYTCYFVYIISMMSALADVADENEIHTDLRQEGMIFSIRTFFGKLSTGLGSLVAGVYIDLIGFPAGQRSSEIEPEVVYKLGILDGAIAIIPALLTLYFLSRYDINHERHREINSVLALKKGR
ncbi:MAG: MFS transporter [Gammaproteobacteria bacterium]|nr:MFS transporter [Gammaproteobacteria bacterium]